MNKNKNVYKGNKKCCSGLLFKSIKASSAHFHVLSTQYTWLSLGWGVCAGKQAVVCAETSLKCTCGGVGLKVKDFLKHWEQSTADYTTSTTYFTPTPRYLNQVRIHFCLIAPGFPVWSWVTVLCGVCVPISVSVHFQKNMLIDLSECLKKTDGKTPSRKCNPACKCSWERLRTHCTTMTRMKLKITEQMISETVWTALLPCLKVISVS